MLVRGTSTRTRMYDLSVFYSYLCTSTCTRTSTRTSMVLSAHTTHNYRCEYEYSQPHNLLKLFFPVRLQYLCCTQVTNKLCATGASGWPRSLGVGNAVDECVSLATDLHDNTMKGSPRRKSFQRSLRFLIQRTRPATILNILVFSCIFLLIASINRIPNLALECTQGTIPFWSLSRLSYPTRSGVHFVLFL